MDKEKSCIPQRQVITDKWILYKYGKKRKAVKYI